jgi:hypothetical protein
MKKKREREEIHPNPGSGRHELDKGLEHESVVF